MSDINRVLDLETFLHEELQHFDDFENFNEIIDLDNKNECSFGDNMELDKECSMKGEIFDLDNKNECNFGDDMELDEECSKKSVIFSTSNKRKLCEHSDVPNRKCFRQEDNVIPTTSSTLTLVESVNVFNEDHSWKEDEKINLVPTKKQVEEKRDTKLLLRLGSENFELFNSRNSINSLSVFEKLTASLKKYDIWRPREGFFPDFIVSYNMMRFTGKAWWSDLPCENLIRFVLVRQLNSVGPNGVFFLEGKYFIFEFFKLKIVHGEQISWVGNKRILLDIPTVTYKGNNIILPFEFASKRETILRDHKLLFDKFFHTGEIFCLYHRTVKFVDNSLVRVCGYDQWFDDNFKQLVYREKRLNIRVYSLRFDIPFEWKINLFGTKEEGISSIKRHVLESRDPLGTPILVGGVKWMLQGTKVNRYFGP
ncbi:uncharacterized protein LOC122508848 isoform X2 [Leptopilina heterotoma]|uniref:uncharacterized protein LOC122505426 isoform X2 n=1 Tax=Leptopilina heterotoma TaxID=63436 RepID=UPI001CA9E835|nr:uncharacterized protein LOC122505426 isoform X2 [Leptopilina heterotoma]XP_043473840.1 uncharacterized protein LOC122505979 isoform X2 [Leptopilina heterotoma]XP_043478364.1 uncharacterized protein LOC122508848 isoform X2 [Leptopilina heterotoma]